MRDRQTQIQMLLHQFIYQFPLPATHWIKSISCKPVSKAMVSFWVAVFNMDLQNLKCPSLISCSNIFFFSSFQELKLSSDYLFLLRAQSIFDLVSESWKDNEKVCEGYRRSPLFCANIDKKDPGRARQNSLATEGTNFTKPGAQNKVDPCMAILGRA